MQMALEELKLENEDLKVSLSLNKESLKEMIREQTAASNKETSLIQTIKIISMENTKLTQALDSLKLKMMSPQTLVDRDVQTEMQARKDHEMQTESISLIDASTDCNVSNTAIGIQTDVNK